LEDFINGGLRREGGDKTPDLTAEAAAAPAAPVVTIVEEGDLGGRNDDGVVEDDPVDMIILYVILFLHVF
jgi:hypothetical protein